MRRGFAALLILGLLLIPGCGQPASKADTGAVTVTAVDSSGNALKGASVTLTGDDGATLTAVSDASGKAVFNGVAYGDYDVTSEKDGYAAGSGSVTVSEATQDTEVSMEAETAAGNSTATSDETGAAEVSDSSVLDSLHSYRYSWTVRDMGATATTSFEGGFEKPNDEYFITRDKDGKSTMEFYKVDGTVKLGSGDSWQTLTGKDATDMGFGDSFVSTLSGDYSFVKDHDEWKKSDGGSVNGYDTDKYVYSYTISGITTQATAWIIKTGEFKGVITRYQVTTQDDADSAKSSSYVMDVTDLGKPLGIKLP
jgi:hypothetical protein